MTGISFLKTGFVLMGITLTACATTQSQDDVPDIALQHTLNVLTSKQSYIGEDSSGRSFVIRPLGTFWSGNAYCRDYEVGVEGVREQPVKRTACRFDERWTPVDPSKLDL